MTEDGMLDRIAALQYLAMLPPEHRTVLSLLSGYDVPADWPTHHAVTLSNVGEYVGRKFRGQPLSEATIRFIRDKALRYLNPQLGEKSAKMSKSSPNIATNHGGTPLTTT